MLVELIKNKCLITDEYKDEVEKYKLTKEKERIEKDYKNLENNIAEVVSKYYEPTDEEIKIDKDN
ncbi:5535_t:CDS:2 [Entrophospora sp. SA101]|nr:5535_t:CDS:2 [Entrophospora sp. SA101]